MVPWTAKDIPPQTGKTVIVTGATSGLGYETALYFLQAGATVIVAGRNESKGKDALEKLQQICPEGKVVFGNVDQCSLSSVTQFCTYFLKNYEKLDILINNAGLATKVREMTPDGFEAQMETNHLSHFLMTALLLPALRRSKAPRVVNVSSFGSHFGKMNFEDLQAENFKDARQYCVTKLANLLFTFELQRRSDAGNWGLFVTAAHPGMASTPMLDGIQKDQGTFSKRLAKFLTHTAAEGALSIMYAATAQEADKSGYYGPQNKLGCTGPPGKAKKPKASKSLEDAKKLWEISEALTKANWPSS